MIKDWDVYDPIANPVGALQHFCEAVVSLLYSERLQMKSTYGNLIFFDHFYKFVTLSSSGYFFIAKTAEDTSIKDKQKWELCTNIWLYYFVYPCQTLQKAYAFLSPPVHRSHPRSHRHSNWACSAAEAEVEVEVVNSPGKEVAVVSGRTYRVPGVKQVIV